MRIFKRSIRDLLRTQFVGTGERSFCTTQVLHGFVERLPYIDSLLVALNQIEGDMDMTPMVDVTFLLLIFFMVTAAFSLQKSIEIPKPADNQASTQVIEKEEEDDQTITVIIDQFNTFRVLTADIEEEAPGKHDLLRRLRRLLDEATPGSVPNKLLVKAHGEATHERVVIALDVGAEVGMEQVQLMTIEEDL